MEIIKYPAINEIAKLLSRPAGNIKATMRDIEWIMTGVQQGGDAAIKKYTKLFENVSQETFCVQEQEWAAISEMSAALKDAIDLAYQNIYTFHKAQLEAEKIVETMPGIACWRKSVPIQKVGLYIPGGSAPLFSTLLMLGIPALIAGCKEIVVCSPAGKDGLLHPAVLYVAQKLGINKIYKIGGAQAIAAMAYGTETVSRVDKIFGPGNRYVTAAKAYAQADGIAIDMPAGPSEVLIIADNTADPAFVAADLLAQAEHGPDSQVLLVTDSESLLEAVKAAIEQQIADLPRRELVQQSLAYCKMILAENLADAMAISNLYAPEHLIINTADAQVLAAEVVNAGSVFIGNYSPESVGDYASGTNHTLPTGGFATAFSGVSLDSFFKKITFQEITADGLKGIGQCVTTMAMAEGLQAHAQSVAVRLASLSNKNQDNGFE